MKHSHHDKTGIRGPQTYPSRVVRIDAAIMSEVVSNWPQKANMPHKTSALSKPVHGFCRWLSADLDTCRPRTTSALSHNRVEESGGSDPHKR